MRVVAWLCEASPSHLSAFNMPASPTRPASGGSRGDTRGGPYLGEQTHAPALSLDSLHTLDRGRYRLWGEGQTGRGQKPLPLSVSNMMVKGREEG